MAQKMRSAQKVRMAVLCFPAVQNNLCVWRFVFLVMVITVLHMMMMVRLVHERIAGAQKRRRRSAHVRMLLQLANHTADTDATVTASNQAATDHCADRTTGIRWHQHCSGRMRDIRRPEITVRTGRWCV